MQLLVLSLQILIGFSPQAKELAIQVVVLYSHSAIIPKIKANLTLQDPMNMHKDYIRV